MAGQHPSHPTGENVAASEVHVASDLALVRFLFGGIGDDDAADGLFLGIDALDDDAIVKRAESHAFLHLQTELS
jgi:hypothetical protein